MISTSRAPSAAARSTPRNSARYSATLLVAVPIGSASSSTTPPSGPDMTTPIAAGPGLPRAPPSTCSTSLPVLTGRSVARHVRQLAGHARSAPIATLPLPAGARRGVAPAALAPVDDDGDIRVLRVIAGELVQQLVLEVLGYHA